MEFNKFNKSIPVYLLILIWILTLFFRPVEDLPFTYFTGFLDAIISRSKFQIVIFGLPVLTLLALTWTYIQFRIKPAKVSERTVYFFGKASLIISLIYSTVILLLDKIYSGIMHYSRAKAKSHWGVDVNGDVVDEIALIFYWFNIFVPILYFLFLFFFRKANSMEKDNR